MVMSALLLMGASTLVANAELVDVIDYQQMSLSQLFDEKRVTPQFKANGFGTASMDLVGKLSNEGFTVCLALHSSGENGIVIVFESLDKNLEITFLFWECKVTSCAVWVLVTDNSYKEVSKTLPPRLSGWLDPCIAIDRINNKISISIAGIVITTVDYVASDYRALKVKPISYHGFIFPEKITMVNIHKLTEDWYSLKCGEPGNLYSWNIKSWRDAVLPEVPSSRGVRDIICENKPIRILPKLNFENAVDICQRLNQGKILFESADKFKEIVEQSGEFIGAGRYADFWVPFRSYTNDANYINIYTNESHDVSLFGEGENNGTSHCLSWSENQYLDDDPCETELYFSVCLESEQRSLNVRGLCAKSEIDTLFNFALDTENALFFTGNRFCFIKYDKVTHKWKVGSVMSTVSADISSYYGKLLLGTHTWHIHNDDACTEDQESYDAKISISQCSLESFNCHNGHCIDLDKSCDGVSECSDGSDEQECSTLMLDDVAYNKELITAGDSLKKLQVHMDIKIIDIISIEDKENLFRPKYEITFKWQDHRLRFRNLREGKESGLTEEELQQIWTPNIVWDEVNQFNRDTYSRREIFAISHPGAIHNPGDRTLTHGAYVYNGSDTYLVMRESKSAFSVATFSMRWFPFDVQICSINIQLTAGQQQLAELVHKHISYVGDVNIQQFILYSVEYHDFEGDDQIHAIMVFGRNVNGFLVTTAVPTVIAVVIGHTTNYFGDDLFDAAIGVNLTILLVLTTMLIDIAQGFSQSDGFGFVATWMFVGLTLPFVEVLLQSWRQTLRIKLIKSKDEDTKEVRPWTSKISGTETDEDKKQNLRDMKRLKRRIGLITFFLCRLKPVLYIIFVLSFFSVGFLHKQYQLRKYIGDEH